MSTKCVTDFDVTYGSALAPAGFHRITTRVGGSANLNTTSSSQQSFLWTHEGLSRGNPVIKVSVTYDDEPGPEGFERVSRDLAKGGTSGRKAFLWLKRHAHQRPKTKTGAGSPQPTSEDGTEKEREDGVLPISEVVVAFGSADPNAEEAAEIAEQERVAAAAAGVKGMGGGAAEERAVRVWEKLDRSLNPPGPAGGESGEGRQEQRQRDQDGSAVFLWFRRVSEEEPLSWSAHSLTVGDWLDARDSDGTWCVAQVVRIEGEIMRVHFQGYSSKYDEDIRLESSKLAKLGTHTAGRDTGQSTRRPGAPWAITPHEVRQVISRVKGLLPSVLREGEGGVPGEGYGGAGQGQGVEARLWEMDLPAFIERCLSSSVNDLEALPCINDLFKLVLEVIAVRLWQPAPMPRHLLQTLTRLGHNDDRCKWYYTHYGRSSGSYEGMSSAAAAAAASAGTSGGAGGGPRGLGEEEFVVAERKPEWDKVYVQQTRGGIRAGFQQDASRLYVANMNHFGRAGGYAALLSRINPNRAAGPVPLEEFVTYTGFLAVAPKCFAPFSKDNLYFEDVRRAVMARLGRLSNDELAGEEETVMATMSFLGELMSVMDGNFNKAEHVERFHIMFAIQLIRCPFLNPRIRGVTILSDIIDVTIRNATARRRSRSKGVIGVGGGNHTYGWVGEEWLATWLAEERVVEAILGQSDAGSAGTQAAAAADKGEGSQGSKNKGDDHDHAKNVHDTHVEVLKRADGLLCFMADHDMVSDKHLGLLWAAGRGQPDAQVRAVFRLLEHLFPRLDRDGLDVLYGHLRNMPPQYEEMHVHLIRRFAEAASGWGAQGGSAERTDANTNTIFGRGGNELLWETMQDHAPVTAEVADQASEALAFLLCHPSGPDGGSSYNSNHGRLQTGMAYLGGGGAAATAAAREGEVHWKRLLFFFDMCLENVEGEKSVAPSLRLMQRIIDAQPEASTSNAWANAVVGSASGGGTGGARSSGGAGRKDEILETLDKDRSLLKLLVDELLLYRERAQTAATEAGANVSLADSLGSTISSGGGGAAGARDPLSLKLLRARLPHGEALEIRLDFIGFVVSKSNLELNFGLVETLWRDFLENPLCDSETEIFFSWMQRTTPSARALTYGAPSSKGFYTMSSTVVHQVFRHLLCQEGGVDFDSLGPKGFWCLWKFFSVVNMESNALSASTVNKNEVVVQDFFAIQGLDTLWQAFLRSSHPSVVKDSGDLLTQLHLRLRAPLDNASDVWERREGPEVSFSLVERCMNTFAAALRDAEVMACERVMRLLVKFLDEVDSPSVGSRLYSTVSNRNSKEFTVKVSVRGANTGHSASKPRELCYDMERQRVTVGELRGRVGHEMAHPANQVRLICHHKMLAKDLALLNADGMVTYIEAVLLDKPMDDTRGYRPHPRSKWRPWDSNLPRKIPRDTLANNGGFLNILFRLMEVGPPSLVDVTWALVQTLPVNERIHLELNTMGGRWVRVFFAGFFFREVSQMPTVRFEEEVHTGAQRVQAAAEANGMALTKDAAYAEAATRIQMDLRSGEGVAEVDWAALLNGSRVLELLYRLEVVYTLIEPAGDVCALPGDLVDANEWVRVFLRTGGMQHLLSLLGRDGGSGIDIDPSQSMHKACLAALLKLIAHLTASSKTATADASSTRGKPGAENPQDVVRQLYAGVDLAKLVQRMLVVMHEVSKPTESTAQDHQASTTYAVDGNGSVSPTTSSLAAVEEADGKHRPPPEAEVVQHTMSLLAALTELEPELCSVMLSSPGLGPALEFSLLHTPEKLVRREVSTGVLRMAVQLREKSKEDSVQGFLRLLLPFLPEVEQYESRCETYLNLVGWLIGQRDAMPPEKQGNLCLHLADLICSRPAVEQSEEDQDPVLLGYMTFLKKALKTLPGGLRAQVKAAAGADPTPLPTPSTAAGPADAGPAATTATSKPAAAGVKRSAGAGSPSAAASRAVSAVTAAAGSLRCLFSLPHDRGSDVEACLSGGDGGGDRVSHRGETGDAEDDGYEGIPLPKCKSEKSREVAFILLNELAIGCPSNLELTVALVEPQHYLGLTSEEGRRRLDEEHEKDRDVPQFFFSFLTHGCLYYPMVWRCDVTRRAHARARAASFGQQPNQIAKHKSKTGFVGLKNMGCICYMNSTLQQLFMVPEFREGVLSFRHSDQTLSEDSLMWQLQNMFSHLQESEKAHFNPVGLVRSLRDWEGQPLDVMVQQDASEFITQFFQQVEGQVMGSCSENILKQSFGGVYSNELLAEGGRLYSERPEPFSYISVEVKNMKTLAEALEVFTAEEVVSFKWDKEINVDTGERQAVTLNTKKRCSIKSLPNHLLIHLKRFDFDFDTMQQTKINDRLDFPVELNMYPFTKEGRAASAADEEEGEDDGSREGGTSDDDDDEDDVRDLDDDGDDADDDDDATLRKSGGQEGGGKPEDYYQYHLAGVVVHMGTANSGHYYSYIRPRDGGGEWLEFNDTVVSTFDVEDMEAECFGGEEKSKHGTYPRSGQSSQQTQYGSSGGGNGPGSSSSSAWKRERTRNAFMLVYDRKMPQQQQQGERGSEFRADDGSRRGSPLPPSPRPQRSVAAAVNSSAAAAAAAASPTANVGADQPLDGAEGTGAIRGRRRRKRFRARVPAVFMRQIHRENLEFWRKKNVLDRSNYAFIKKLVFQATDEGGVSSGSALQLAARFTLGTLVQAREKEMMPTWAGLLSKHLPLRPDASVLVLSDLARFPVVLKELLLSPEEGVRFAAALVAGVALGRCMLTATGAGKLGQQGGSDDVDVYLEACTAVADGQGQPEVGGLLEVQSGGDCAEVVAGAGKEGRERVAAAEAEGEDDDQASLVKKTGMLSIWGGRQEGMAPSHRVRDSRGRTPAPSRGSEQAAAAAAVVLFVKACLSILSAAPDIMHLEWMRSKELLSLLSTVAAAGPCERSLLLHAGTLGALMSMCLGEDSPYPELVQSPRPRRRLQPGDGGGSSSPASPRRPYRSSFPPRRGRRRDGTWQTIHAFVSSRLFFSYPHSHAVWQGRDLSTLLEAMSPLILASELAWGESEDDASAIEGGGDGGGLSPAALGPLSRMSEEEKQMLTSPAFLMRLIMPLREPTQKPFLVPLLQHLCWRNRLVSKVVISNICERIEIFRDIDAHLSKPAFRALMLILTKVPDGLEQWRLDQAMPRILDTLEEHSTLVMVTEQAVEMLVRLCRVSSGVRRWLAAHRERLEWVGPWLTQAVVTKQKRGGGVGSRYYRLNGPPTSVTDDTVCPSEMWHEDTLASIRAVIEGEDMPTSGYDSDDDPQVLLNKRVKVKWRGDTWYPGTISEYNPSTKVHTCMYDDGDVRDYEMFKKTWRLTRER
ncbi:unnamed protein product [Scytosiphon promiscuus]